MDAPERLTCLLAHAQATSPSAFAHRTRELAWIANALTAGCTLRGRAFASAEASRIAAATCNLGLERAGDLPETWLVDHALIDAFVGGWSCLHHEVGMRTAARLADVLADLRIDDDEIQRDLAWLRRALIRQHAAGTPWRARERAEVLAVLDPVAAVALDGLLSECPVASPAITALVDGATGPIAPTAIDVIATPARLGEIRLFLRLLPDLLAR